MFGPSKSVNSEILLIDGGKRRDHESSRESRSLGDIDGGDAVKAEVVVPSSELIPGRLQCTASRTPRRKTLRNKTKVLKINIFEKKNC